MNKKKILLFGSIIFLVGFILGNTILTSSAILDLINPPSSTSDLPTDYNYKFLLSNKGTCDIKSLKENLHYEGLPWIDQALLIYPELEIGFYKPLDKENETLLLDLMKNREQEMCNPPRDLTYEFTATINPDTIAKVLYDNFGIKSYYIANGITGDISVSIKDPISLTTSQDMRDALCTLWEVHGKK